MVSLCRGHLGTSGLRTRRTIKFRMSVIDPMLEPSNSRHIDNNVSVENGTHSMRSVIGASKMDHAIEAGERSASTLTMMLVEFLLGQDVSTVLM